MAILINTNHRPIPMLDWSELTPREREQFDYRTPDDGALYVRYKGTTYDVSDMARATGRLADLAWDGQSADSVWTGVVLRLVTNDDYPYGDHVVMGSYTVTDD